MERATSGIQQTYLVIVMLATVFWRSYNVVLHFHKWQIYDRQCIYPGFIQVKQIPKIINCFSSLGTSGKLKTLNKSSSFVTKLVVLKVQP